MNEDILTFAAGSMAPRVLIVTIPLGLSLLAIRPPWESHPRELVGQPRHAVHPS